MSCAQVGRTAPAFQIRGLPAVCGGEAMAAHSSALAWKIPRTEEPGRLQSLGWRRVRHDWATSLSLFTFTHWRRKWQPTPVFLPGESQGRRSLAGCRLWGRRVGHDWSDLAAAAACSWRWQWLLIREWLFWSLPVVSVEHWQGSQHN